MLEKERLLRAQSAAVNFPENDSLDLYLKEELATQNALEALGAKGNPIPSEVKKVGRYFMTPELIENLRTPYAVEVVGMPGGGKSTMITRYLEEQWENKRRYFFAHVDEGARSLKGKHGDMRYTNPFEYSFMGATVSYLHQLKSTDSINQGLRVIVTDRGQQDRNIFKRTLFLQGKVNPFFMSEISKEVDKWVDTPIQMGGVIMFMVRPETSIKRIGKLGPVVNPEYLPFLYEQYWRLHWELLQAEIPYRIYTCIDAEKDEEEVYVRFKYAMDSIFNLHTTMLQALYKVFPEETDQVMEALKQNPDLGKSNAEKIIGQKLGGKRVKIIGGDDLVDPDNILKKPFVEMKFLKK